MKYFLKINQLSSHEQECLKDDCCRKRFWNKDIEISEKFYSDLVKHVQVMLIPEMHDNDKLVLNFHHYFDRTIEFTFIKEIRVYDKIILLCELDSFFIPTNSEEEPF